MLKTDETAILDLRQWPLDAIALIDEIANVRTVVLRPEAARVYLQIPKRNVRSHLILDHTEELLIGQHEISSILDSETRNGAPNGDLSIVVLGHLFVESRPPDSHIRRLKSCRIYGQVFYENISTYVEIQGICTHHQGQTIAIPPRTKKWIGPTKLTDEKLSGLGGDKDVVNIGTLEIARDVTPGMIHKNIGKIVLIGELKGSATNCSALMGHCPRRLGTIHLTD